MKTVKIGDFPVGTEERAFIIAEIGINHNGDVVLAKKLIDMAVTAGCDAVKFQKRTIDVVYSIEELQKPRAVCKTILEKAIKRCVLSKEAEKRLIDSDFESSMNGDLKYALELKLEEYIEIDDYCKSKGIMWFASCWDEESVDFIDQFNPPCYKIASPSITDDDMLRHTRSKGKPIILSTGMSDDAIIERAVEVVGRDNLILMHAVSTYPAKNEELNLLAIPTMKERYRLPVGYSGHEVGIFPVVAAAVLGACALERHITLDRAMWGSDQPASVEPQGLEKIIGYVREWEQIKGDGIKKILPSEVPIIKKLRRK